MMDGFVRGERGVGGYLVGYVEYIGIGFGWWLRIRRYGRGGAKKRVVDYDDDMGKGSKGDLFILRQ